MDAYLLEEDFYQISPRFDLKQRRALGFSDEVAPCNNNNNNNKMSSDMR